MATLLLTAVGTALGGPLGGALGALAGRQIDQAIIGSPRREGPRLKELAVTTSSYGAAIPRLFGRVRTAGTIIWSTDLVERSETSGGGKGQPSLTSYSYSVSFAVALSSRPVAGIGRIWADGNLLRGSAGDLKVAGAMRFHDGHGDHGVDPLIAAAHGPNTPGFRGLAHVVFENLDLAEFGNRIPALTFEIIADEGDVQLADILQPLGPAVVTDRPLPGLAGYADEGGALLYQLATIDALYPVSADVGANGLQLRDFQTEAPPALLPVPAVAEQEDAYGFATGRAYLRGAEARPVPTAVRYYDPARDYQAGMQRADGRARPGRDLVLEFPGTLSATEARRLANEAAQRAVRQRDRMAWRMAELDPALGPGRIVRVPGKAGLWRIESWEWRDRGVEVQLSRQPHGPAASPPAEAGTALPKPDLPAGTSLLSAFELPLGSLPAPSRSAIHVAVSSASPGWKGAALFADRDGALEPLGSSGERRAVLGQTLLALAPSAAAMFDPQAALEVQLAAPDMLLASASMEQLAQGANRLLIGAEILQFLEAEPLGSGHWRLTGLLRGRGGSETAAGAGHPAGSPVVALDDGVRLVEPDNPSGIVPSAIVAIGLGDPGPVSAAIGNRGASLRPLCPVHPRAERLPDGGLRFSWVRRARGSWAWPEETEVALGESREAWLVGLGPMGNPPLRWERTSAQLVLGAEELAQLESTYPGAALWVRQVGDRALSDPLLLHLFA